MACSTWLSLLLLIGCANLPDNASRVTTQAFDPIDNGELANYAAHLRQEHPAENAMRPLISGEDALLTRLALIHHATQSMDLQYYIWHNDLTGKHLAAALLVAADRGVRVRVLIDDVGTKINDENVLALDAHPNIDIRVFNPIATRSFRLFGLVSEFDRTNRRMHNKALIADNQAAVLGGRNIGDEYFNATEGVAFADLDVLVFGQAVPNISQSYDLFWNHDASYPMTTLTGKLADEKALASIKQELKQYITEQQNDRYVTYAKELVSEYSKGQKKPIYYGDALLLFDHPDKIHDELSNKQGHLLPQFEQAKISASKELILVSPYFIPGEQGINYFKQLRAQGVKVTILTNSLAASDVSAVHAGYEKYRERLLALGVVLYELKPTLNAKKDKASHSVGSSGASLHAKTFIFDREQVFIGSLNLDPRSVTINTEIGLVCKSSKLAEDLARQLLTNIDELAWRVELQANDAQKPGLVWIEKRPEGEVRYTSEPSVSVWRRFSVWFFGLLDVESQL